MTDKQITVPSETVDELLDMIENRIREIGGTYKVRNSNYRDDLEVERLNVIARQLGYEFDLIPDDGNFKVARVEAMPSEA